MKVLNSLLSLVILHGGFSLKAQHSVVYGSVIDIESNEVVAGALVTLQNNDEYTFTDANGNFAFNHVNPGNDSIFISLISYQSERASLVIPHGDTVRLNTTLNPSTIELSGVHITAEPGQQAKVIADIDIHLRATNTSQDILKIIPGLFIAQHAGGGKAEQIFLRGFDIDHGTDIAISTDGMPVNLVSHAHGQGYADLHFLIPETIGRVQFGKGPYQVEQGNLATAGYVGFQTLNTLDENTFSFQAGQNNSFRGLGLFRLIDHASGSSVQNAYIAAEFNTTDGYFDHPQDFQRLNLFGKYNAAIGRSNYLTVSCSTFSSRWNASGQIPIRAVDSGMIGHFGAIDKTEGGQTSRTNINGQLTTTLNSQQWLKNQVYFSQYGFELFSNFTFFLKDSIHGDQIKQKERRNLFGYNGSYSREDIWFGKKITSEIGLQLRHDYSRDNELSHTAQRTTILQRLSYGDIKESNLGLYWSETISLTDHLTVDAGLRLDHFVFGYADHLENTDFQTVNAHLLSPKINAHYQVSNSLQLSGNAGYGFHSNDTRVVVRQEGFKTLPRAFGLDAGILWKPFRKLVVSMNLWRLALDQEFVYVGDEGIVEPSGRTLRKGIEFSGRLELLKWLFADLDFNYTHAKSLDEEQGQHYIPLAPKLSSIGGLSVISNKQWNGSLRYRYLGNRPANEDNSVIANGYFLIDLLANYRIKKFELGFTVENVLNTLWKETQFETESRLQNEKVSVSEIHFTPGTPLNLKAHASYHF